MTDTAIQASGIERRRLGRTDIRLTSLAFGGAGVFCNRPRSTAEAAFEAAWEAGIRYFDTAPFYGHGLSERRMGDCLRSRPRDSYILSTKVGRLLRPGPSEQDPPSPAPGRPPLGIRLDYSYDGVMRSFEASLERYAGDAVRLRFVSHHDPCIHYEGTLIDDVTLTPARCELEAEAWIEAPGPGWD